MYIYTLQQALPHTFIYRKQCEGVMRKLYWAKKIYIQLKEIGTSAHITLSLPNLYNFVVLLEIFMFLISQRESCQFNEHFNKSQLYPKFFIRCTYTLLPQFRFITTWYFPDIVIFGKSSASSFLYTFICRRLRRGYKKDLF